MVKSLILPTLTYPVTPLNSASRSSIINLQRVQNKALNFIYDVRWPMRDTARSMHTRASMQPLNQVIHNRVCTVWSKIEGGISADYETFRKITEFRYIRPHQWFPSSFLRTRKEVPPAIYTLANMRSHQVREYYNN